MLSTFGGGSVRGFGGGGAAGGGDLPTHPHDIEIPSNLNGLSDDDINWTANYSNTSVHTMYFIRDGVHKGQVIHHDNGDRDLVRFTHPNGTDTGEVTSSGTITKNLIVDTSSLGLGRAIAIANDGSWHYSTSNDGKLYGWNLSNINGAWNVTGLATNNATRTYSNVGFGSFTALSFNYDGSAAYGISYGSSYGNKMYKFSSVSNYDISASTNSLEHQFLNGTNVPSGPIFSWKWFNQGTKALCTDLDNYLYLMSFSTAYDFSTISYDQKVSLDTAEAASVGSYYIDFDVTSDGSKILFAIYGNSNSRFFRQWSL